MRGHFYRWGLVLALTTTAFYALRGDNTTVPQSVIDSLKLLKKPIEDLLPDLEEAPTAAPDVDLEAPLDLEPYQDLHNQRQRWNEMRSLIESGQPLFTPLPSEVSISTTPTGRLAPAIPPPPGFTVQLPYESRLTVSGRKVIGLDWKSTAYTNPTYATQLGIPTSQSSFQLQQQLQVKINGQVGRKVTVNVDFDDTKTDKKDISIVYKGDPDEIVQRAAFGDITLSLPQTEFVGYSKQVFGASAELKYKALHGYVIGSRTKGETETKEFTGNVILQRLQIPDISYVRHTFYNVTKLTGRGADANAPGINPSSLAVYLDNRDQTRPTNLFLQPDPVTVDGSLLLPGATTYTGHFVKLAPGVDYTFDPTTGIITFRNALLTTGVLAVNYTLPPGTSGAGQLLSTQGAFPGELKMIKFDETVITQIPVTEDLTHYSFGVTKIVRDNGQGNFTLQVQDLNGSDATAATGVQYLPNSGGNVYVDFEAGVFRLLNGTTLASKNGSYSVIYAPAPTHLFNFYTEFQAQVKTYTLRPNIVLNSERITLNGRVLTRDVDYFIDYQSGFVTFFNTDQITQDSHITATYDFSPFGIAGAQQDTLVGERTELSMYPLGRLFEKSLIGSTVLYDFAPQQAGAPDIHQTAGSFLVTEADIHFKDLVFDPLPFLKSSFTAEGARSAHNPNSNGEAIIDTMNGIKDETSVGLNVINWQVAATPSQPQSGCSGATVGCGQFYGALAGGMSNETDHVLDIDPNAAALPGDETQVLDLTYNLSQSNEASIVSVLSPTGLDFSQKLYVEMYILGDGSAQTGNPSGTQLDITLGQISEDADGTNGGGFCDTQIGGSCHGQGDGTPRTEDLNHNGTLDIGEDVGWVYYDPPGGQGAVHVIANNLHLDSEDLDRNGVMNPADPTLGGDVGYASTTGSTFTVTGTSPGSGVNTLDFSGWQLIRVPLNIPIASSTTQTVVNNWSAIKEMRFSLKAGSSTGPKAGTIKIGRISVVGNKWQSETPIIPGSTVSNFAIGNQTDPNYVSLQGNPDYDNLTQVNTAISGPQPAKKAETALAIDYSFAAGIAGASVTVKSVYLSPMDFTQYGQIRFFLYKFSPTSTNGAVYFFRVGSDTDFWEFSVPLDNVPNGWIELYINQVDSSGGQNPNTWQVDGRDPLGSLVRVQGNPNLAQVAQLKGGVLNTNQGGTSGEIWMNAIFAADAITRIGYAGKLQSDFELLGWAKFGVSVRDIDRNFETFTSAITNQDRHEDAGYLNFTRLAYFPWTLTGTKTRTDTPNVNQISNTSLVSVQASGRVDDTLYAWNGVLQIPKTPKLGLLYDHDDTKTNLLFREDETTHYGGTLDYAVPIQKFYLPKTVSLGYKRTNLDINFDNPDALETQQTDPYLVSNTKDHTDDYSARLSFQPVSAFTFNPNWARSVTHESKDALLTDPTTTFITGILPIDYDKTKSQTMGFDSVLALKRWFAPRMRYTETNTETYGIPLASNPTADLFKTVDRTDTGEFTWDFAWRDMTHRVRALQSLNMSSSYLQEDGDTWNNVTSGYDALNIFSVRQALRPGNPEATIAQQTLRDTVRSTQRWNPFDWATNWSGMRLPLRTLSLTSTITDTKQRQDTTGTQSRILTHIYPDLVISMTQTEYFFHAQSWMSNSQMNIKTQDKTVDTQNTSLEKATTNGGDWRFSLLKKYDVFLSYVRTTDNIFDEINNVTSSDAHTETLSAQVGFNVGKWRITPKYDQSIQHAVDANGNPTTDLTTRTPAIQFYADLFLPAGLRLPFGDILVFSNRVRTTSTVSLTQVRSSLNALQNNTDTYAIQTSEDYELTSNIRLTVGGTYSYQVNKVSSQANFYSYEFNSLMTIQF